MATRAKYDLVVVGSGFAGCMTVLNFLEQCEREKRDGKVALVEVGKEGERSGASKWTMAYLRLDKDLNFDEDWVKEMRLLKDEAPISARYLEEHGVKFVHHDEPNVLLEFKTGQHFVFPEGGGCAIIFKLFEHINKYKNCDVIYETEANKLLVDDEGAIRGVKVRKNDGLLHELLAPNVMLACGGFEGNQEYVGRDTHKLPLIAPGLKYNKGAGLKMALDVGADTAGSFDGMHCELVDTRATKPDAVIWGHNYGIVVNKECQRFYDEGKRHLFATFEMIALECWKDQDMSCFFVTDDVIWEKFRGSWVYDTTDQPPEKADTIEELAVKLKLNPQALKRTVHEFNAAVNDRDFDLLKLDGKATTGLKPDKTNWAMKIEKAPFYGYPMTPNLTFTYGGLKTDLHARVLSTHGAPIPGLWAAGELTGLFYNEYPPATSCLRSMTFGRLAGKEIAENLGKSHGTVQGVPIHAEMGHKKSHSVMMSDPQLSAEAQVAA
ncbi:hypothetical protein AMS68_005240 [Peltaster fructicola]|uniref:FAD-dependent oxidoreductase 2 FAD-binding domain-containing protein n=1 Tax=Peltaster fructicola TaxID=286661 RepID=A0A6H0XY87_9PEZI|nr:hypothetical protein AMS68_005240 [Peltaster fructicola]